MDDSSPSEQSKSNDSWINKISTIIVTAIISGFVGIVFANYLDEKKELSYATYEPAPFNDENNLDRPDLIINGKKVDDLYVYKIHIENTGNTALENIEIEIDFVDPPAEFLIFSDFHQLNPSSISGEFSPDKQIHGKRKFKYTLLNEGDSDIVSIFCNDELDIKVGSHHPNTKFIIFDPDKEIFTSEFFSILSIILSILSVIMILYVKLVWLPKLERKTIFVNNSIDKLNALNSKVDEKTDKLDEIIKEVYRLSDELFEEHDKSKS